MAEAHLAQAPLAHLGLAARVVAGLGEAGVGIAVPPPRRQLALRGESEDAAFRAAAEQALGFALPTAPNTTATGEGVTALWLGPSEWLIVGEAELAALGEVHHAVVDVSESRCVLRLGGPKVRELLVKGTSLDLHDSVFAVGACAQSTMALTHMLLHRLADDEAGPVFELYVHRSFADYLWHWLEVAAAEFGLAVLAPPEG